TIRSPFPRDADRTFRYAPLSIAPDIARKTLGRHEIAAAQSTAIDNEAGLLAPATIPAHCSGEWVASASPGWRIPDPAAPPRRRRETRGAGPVGAQDLAAEEDAHGQ